MVRIKTSLGVISIVPEVLMTLVGDTATSCFGVKGMAMRSVTDGLVHLLKPEAMGKGVHIAYGEDYILIDLHIVVDQGVNIPVLCRSIISEVKYKITEATGIDVRSVDVYVDSISLD